MTVSTERADGSSERNEEIRDDELMGMRWVVSVKHFPQKKVKARLVFLGYEVRDLENELLETATPTPTRRAMHCFLQVAAHHGIELKKADVSGAFLGGREQQADRYMVPVLALADGIGSHKSQTRKIAESWLWLGDSTERMRRIGV